MNEQPTSDESMDKLVEIYTALNAVEDINDFSDQLDHLISFLADPDPLKTKAFIEKANEFKDILQLVKEYLGSEIEKYIQVKKKIQAIRGYIPGTLEYSQRIKLLKGPDIAEQISQFVKLLNFLKLIPKNAYALVDLIDALKAEKQSGVAIGLVTKILKEIESSHPIRHVNLGFRQMHIYSDHIGMQRATQLISTKFQHSYFENEETFAGFLLEHSSRILSKLQGEMLSLDVTRMIDGYAIAYTGRYLHAGFILKKDIHGVVSELESNHVLVVIVVKLIYDQLYYDFQSAYPVEPTAS